MRPKMCNDQIPPPLISTSNSMFLVFTTDGSVSDLGFRATYEFWNKTTPEDPTGKKGSYTHVVELMNNEYLILQILGFEVDYRNS